MVYYEPRVTQADKDYITLRLSQCVMKIRHDHGPYRHLRCYWPNDPIGSPYCHFDIITGLGAVTIYGNWMRTFTLRRYGDEDMLPGFCNTKELNIDYWAEKLDMKKQAKDAAITAIDTNAFFKDVENLIKVRPGEKFIYLRIALINAAMRMNREDRELLTDNGFIITTIPVIYKKGDSIFASYDGFEELTLYLPLYHKGKQCGIDPECADTYAALSVFKHLGEDVKKFISKNSPNYR